MSRDGGFIEVPNSPMAAREMRVVGNYAGDPDHLTGTYNGSEAIRTEANSILFVKPANENYADYDQTYVAVKPKLLWNNDEINRASQTISPTRS